ncbi:unnamed protein product, partial [Protopolystoma xenopodis]
MVIIFYDTIRNRDVSFDCRILVTGPNVFFLLSSLHLQVYTGSVRNSPRLFPIPTSCSPGFVKENVHGLPDLPFLVFSPFESNLSVALQPIVWP